MISLPALTFMRLVMLYSDTRVRLTGYNLTHAGRVEVFSNGIWGRVCNVWGSWHQKEAAVVCRQLGFQGVIAAFSYPSDSAQFVVMSRVQCVGNETSLQQCQHDDFVNIVALHSCKEVGVVCKPHNFYSDDRDVPIRLKGSSRPNAGRIEILYAGVWGAISSHNWDANDALVVCRQLGYQAGAEAALKNRVFGPFIGPVWLTNLQCTGDEKNMLGCAHDKIANKTEQSPASKFASLICKDGKMLGEMKIRLRGSHQPNMGRIEVHFAGRWGAIYPWSGDLSIKDKASKVVCRQLGYGGASLSGYNMFCSEAVLPWFTNLRCNGSETSLNQCDLDFYSNTSVDCMNVLCINETTNPGFRLSGSSAPNAGRMEIGINGVWGTIGIKRFSRSIVRSILMTEPLWHTCRQLGYNDGVLGTRWMQIGPRRRPVWVLLNCGGNETNIRDCFSPRTPQLRQPSYYFAQDLGVICKPNVPQIKDFQVRLIGTTLPFAGAIEVSYYGVWGGIWGHSIDVRVGHVICRQLGYSGAQQVFRESVFGDMKSPFLVKEIRCNGNESAISQCTILTIDEVGFWDYFDPEYGAAVLCVEYQADISKDFSVRLAGSPISNAGQVEVFYAGVWGTIDSHQWNIKSAHVVCRQLGYPRAISAGASSQFGGGKRTVWFANVTCLGNESNFQECPKSFAGSLVSGRTSTALCKLPYEPALPTPCKYSPCQNGGQCFSSYFWYVCICPDGLTGKRCEERILNMSTDNIVYRKGNTAFNSYIMAIFVLVTVTLVVTVVCLILKIRKLTAQQTTRPTNPAKIYRSNTFQAEPVGEPLEDQRASPTNIDSTTEYACIDDINATFGDYADDVEMSSRPLPPIPSKRTKKYRNNTLQVEPINESLEEQGSLTNTDLGSGYANVDDVNINVRNSEDDVEMPPHPSLRIPSKRPRRKGSLIKATEKPLNNNPEEPSPETMKVHYMGLQGNGKNLNEPITCLTGTSSYMHLSPRMPEHVVYSGLSQISAETITAKQGVKHGRETKYKGRAYATLQKK